ncbi:MAG: hypothetical protein LPK09_01930 [Hymenobacteraceae bacterium]|nr:hypothetical protein [Hymenobacteraceae bacterium]
MSKQPQYLPMARQVFGQYLDNEIDLYTLLERLRNIELQIMADEEEDEEGNGKGMWFRFFEGDTLHTSISDIESDLADASHPNADILKRGIAFGLETNELEVHYS